MARFKNPADVFTNRDLLSIYSYSGMQRKAFGDEVGLSAGHLSHLCNGKLEMDTKLRAQLQQTLEHFLQKYARSDKFKSDIKVFLECLRYYVDENGFDKYLIDVFKNSEFAKRHLKSSNLKMLTNMQELKDNDQLFKLVNDNIGRFEEIVPKMAGLRADVKAYAEDKLSVREAINRVENFFKETFTEWKLLKKLEDSGFSVQDLVAEYVRHPKFAEHYDRIRNLQTMMDKIKHILSHNGSDLKEFFESEGIDCQGLGLMLRSEQLRMSKLNELLKRIPDYTPDEASIMKKIKAHRG